HAASILQGILRQSPGHGHALLEQYLLTGKGTLPSPSQYVSRRELAKVWLSLGMAQEIPSEKKKRCITAQKYWYMPETSICIAQAILRGAGELETTEDHLAHLTPYPIPQVKLLRVEYFIKQLNPDKALKSLVSLKTCKTCDQGAIASLALATAILIEDRDAVKKTCAGKQSPAMIHQCLEGALDLREWPLVKNLVKQLPQGVIPSLIRQAIFSHSLAPAFLPIPKKLLPYEAKILARTLIAAQKYSLAIQLLVANQKENGRNHSLDLVMARAYAAMGRNSRALSILDTVRPHILNHPRSLFETARIYLRLNKLGAAQSIAARISKIVPEGYRSLFLKCLIYLHKKAYDKATKSLEEATKVTTLNPNLLTARARILFFEGKYPDAIKAIEQAVAIDLENPRYFETLARYSRHYKQAHYGIYYLKAAAKYRALAAPYQASRVLATYGETLDIKTMRDEKSKVVAQLERIKKLHPRALAFLAEWQHNQDMNSKKAIVLMEQAIALAPDLPVHSYKLATWLATSQPKKAIKILEKLIVAYSYHAITPMAETLLATLRKGVTP
ncbi:hypothetical protein KKF84_13970, partial [Myxococcota bacterium]|nr:hypothetical protein [Myxococcota bacterium]MBU1536429.1 hypothetical protein [Myxococcota bacterium]